MFHNYVRPMYQVRADYPTPQPRAESSSQFTLRITNIGRKAAALVTGAVKNTVQDTRGVLAWDHTDEELTEEIGQLPVARSWAITNPVRKLRYKCATIEGVARQKGQRLVDERLVKSTTRFSATKELVAKSAAARVDIMCDDRVTVVDSHDFLCAHLHSLRPATEPKDALFATLMRLANQHEVKVPVPPTSDGGAVSFRVVKLRMSEVTEWAIELVDTLYLPGLNAK